MHTSMKNALSIGFLILMLSSTSCVSKKKYAALKAENESLHSVENSLEALNAARKTDADAMRAREELHRGELDELKRQVKILEAQLGGGSNLVIRPEHLEQIERERVQEHERRMLQSMSGHEASAMDVKLNQMESAMRITENSLKGTMSSYGYGTVNVERIGKYLVVSVKNELLYSADGTKLTASGETFINRFLPSLKTAEGLTLSIIGVAESDDSAARLAAQQKSNTLYAALNKNIDFAKCDAITSVLACEKSLGGKKNQCSRTDIVFDYDNDALIDSMKTIK
jgi:chemotaxis protein MotB